MDLFVLFGHFWRKFASRNQGPGVVSVNEPLPSIWVFFHWHTYAAAWEHWFRRSISSFFEQANWQTSGFISFFFLHKCFFTSFTSELLFYSHSNKQTLVFWVALFLPSFSPIKSPFILSQFGPSGQSDRHDWFSKVTGCFLKWKLTLKILGVVGIVFFLPKSAQNDIFANFGGKKFCPPGLRHCTASRQSKNGRKNKHQFFRFFGFFFEEKLTTVWRKFFDLEFCWDFPIDHDILGDMFWVIFENFLHFWCEGTVGETGWDGNAYKKTTGAFKKKKTNNASSAVQEGRLSPPGPELGPTLCWDLPLYLTLPPTLSLFSRVPTFKSKFSSVPSSLIFPRVGVCNPFPHRPGGDWCPPRPPIPNHSLHSLKRLFFLRQFSPPPPQRVAMGRQGGWAFLTPWGGRVLGG